MTRAILSGILILLFATLVAAEPEGAEPPSRHDDLSIGLALGSGGAGGLSHIRFLAVFDELGVRPERISGTSVGAVIGGLYAAGLTAEEIIAIFDDFSGSEIDALSGMVGSDISLTELLPIGDDNGGMVDSSAFVDYLAKQVEARRFEDLEIPLTVVATDFRTGETVTIEEGDLFSAIEASMAVPGLFTPVERDGRLLVDGGLSNPLPYDVLLGHHERVVAVDVVGVSNNGEEAPDTTDMLFKTFELQQQSLIREKLRCQAPDLYLHPDTSDFRLLHFHRLDEILDNAGDSAGRLREAIRKWQAEAAKPG